MMEKLIGRLIDGSYTADDLYLVSVSLTHLQESAKTNADIIKELYGEKTLRLLK